VYLHDGMLRDFAVTDLKADNKDEANSDSVPVLNRVLVLVWWPRRISVF